MAIKPKIYNPCGRSLNVGSDMHVRICGRLYIMVHNSTNTVEWKIMANKSIDNYRKGVVDENFYGLSTMLIHS